MAQDTLEVRGLYAGYYRGIDVLHGVSVKVQGDSVTSIVGPNGSGKSTLLKAIYGIVEPRLGEISFNGRSMIGLSQVELLRIGLALIPQERTVFPLMSVEENLEIAAGTVLHNPVEAKEAIKATYEKFPRLRERRRVRAGRLSGGEQKMVEVARALMFKPKLVMLDEPTAGLSPKLQQEVYGYIKGMRSSGITVTLVDQNVKEAIGVADYVYVLEAGRVKVEGSGQDFRGRVDSVVRMWLRA